MKVAFWRATDSDVRWSEFPSLAGLCIEAHAKYIFGDEVEFEFCASAEELVNADAEVVAIGSVTDAWTCALDAIRQCKARGKYVVVGGRHVTACPKSAPLAADAVAEGEGEQAFADILWTLLRNPSRFGTQGWVGRLLHLDEATHIPIGAFSAPRTLAAVATRGCPYRCTFCSACRFWGERVRRFSPQYIGEWFRRRKGEFDRVGFYDLNFLSDAEWATAAIAELKAAGAGTDFEVTMVSARTDLITDELCRLVASIGVSEIGVGIESGSPRVLAQLKPGASVEAHEHALGLCYKHGITLAGSLIFGTPGETDADLQATYDFLERWLGKHFHTAGLFLLTPYPGTHWWRWARDRDMIPDPVDWSRFRIAAKAAEYELNGCLWLNADMPRERAAEWRRRITQLCGQRDPGRVPEAAR